MIPVFSEQFIKGPLWYAYGKAGYGESAYGGATYGDSINRGWNYISGIKLTPTGDYNTVMHVTLGRVRLRKDNRYDWWRLPTKYNVLWLVDEIRQGVADSLEEAKAKVEEGWNDQESPGDRRLREYRKYLSQSHIPTSLLEYETVKVKLVEGS